MEVCRWRERWVNDLESNKNMFWKKGRNSASEEGWEARDEVENDVNGQILRDGVEVRRKWAEYFEQVLNVEDVREANIL